ncbi:hypothetical protein SDC9_183444 [bioreactor metagenome]|uniref:Uncharacterized protein n=1 Tax=bioreactor metagenome TaxID=1076179 RepID=A0A645HCT9_9ZZZZ
MILNEAYHRGKLRFGFAGEADHQRRAEHELRRNSCHIVQHLADMRLIASAMHSVEHFVLGVLQGHVKIGHDLTARAETVDQLRRDGIGIGVQHS